MRLLFKPKIEFVPSDFWVGIYFKRRFSFLTVYVCLIPCFPIVTFWKIGKHD